MRLKQVLRRVLGKLENYLQKFGEDYACELLAAQNRLYVEADHVRKPREKGRADDDIRCAQPIEPRSTGSVADIVPSDH